MSVCACVCAECVCVEGSPVLRASWSGSCCSIAIIIFIRSLHSFPLVTCAQRHFVAHFVLSFFWIFPTIRTKCTKLYFIFALRRTWQKWRQRTECRRAGLAPLRLIADLGIGPGAADPGLSGCGDAVRRPAFSRTLCPEAPSKGNCRGRLCTKCTGRRHKLRRHRRVINLHAYFAC